MAPKEETAVECIGEVEVAAVPDVKEDQDAAADDDVSKKTTSEKEEKSEEGGSDKATEKQKETDTDQASHSLITVKTKDS